MVVARADRTRPPHEITERRRSDAIAPPSGEITCPSQQHFPERPSSVRRRPLGGAALLLG
jgi:hypothetical protein